MNDQQIAIIAHTAVEQFFAEVNPAYPLAKWENIEEFERLEETKVVGLLREKGYTHPANIHDLFVYDRIKSGWTYGLTYDAMNKISPKLIRFYDLGAVDQQQYELFIQAALAMFKYHPPVQLTAQPIDSTPQTTATNSAAVLEWLQERVNFYLMDRQKWLKEKDDFILKSPPDLQAAATAQMYADSWERIVDELNQIIKSDILK